jgi:hypothetical protein
LTYVGRKGSEGRAQAVLAKAEGRREMWK